MNWAARIERPSWMKFTQCTRARLVDVNFAEAPRAARPLLLASTMLDSILSWPLSGAGTPIVVSHHSEGLATLNSRQPCQLQVFSHHWSFGRLFDRALLPTTRNFVCSLPLDIFKLLAFCSSRRCAANRRRSFLVRGVQHSIPIQQLCVPAPWDSLPGT